MIWHDLYQNSLKLDPHNYPVLISYTPDEHKVSKENMIQIMFESLGVPGVYSSIRNLLFLCSNILESLFSLYGTGKTTGLVVNSGHSISRVVPIIDGYAHSYAHGTSFDGSIDVNFRLESMLAQKYPGLKLEEEIVEEIKVTRCRVRNIGERQETRTPSQNSYEMTYDLPDGNQISLG